MATVIKNLSDIVSLLESYRGRDRVMRILTYVAMFAGSNGKTPGQLKWKTIAGEMNACRTFLRLFDDLSMLMLNLSKGFGMHEKQPIMKLLNVLSALLGQGFYPIEHIAWLRQKKIISGEPGRFMLLGIVFWAGSLFIEIIRSFIKMRGIKVRVEKLLKQRELDKDNTAQNAEIKKSLAVLNKEQKDTSLVLLQSCCDLTNAVSWMPPGVLWAGTLTPRINGILGFISSAVILYRNWPPPRLN